MTGTPSLPTTKKAATGEARNLSKALKERRIHLDHQVCMDLMARARGHASAHAMLAALESTAPTKTKGHGQSTLRVPYKTRDDGTELFVDLPFSAVCGIIQESVALTEAHRAGSAHEERICFDEIEESLQTYGLLPKEPDTGILHAALAAGGDLSAFAAPSGGYIIDPLGLVAQLTGSSRTAWEPFDGPELSAEGQEFWYSEVADCGPSSEDVAEMIRKGFTSGKRWSLDTKVDLEEDTAARDYIAKLIAEGYVEGYDPRWTISIDNREPRTAYVEIGDGYIVVEGGDDPDHLKRLLTAELKALTSEARYAAFVAEAPATVAAATGVAEDLGDPSEGPVWSARVRVYYPGEEEPAYKLVVDVRAHSVSEAMEKAEKKTEEDPEFEGYDEITATDAVRIDDHDGDEADAPSSRLSVATTAYAYEAKIRIVSAEGIGHIAASSISKTVELAVDALLDDGEAAEVELTSDREITVRIGSPEEIRDREATKVIETIRDRIKDRLDAAGETLEYGDLLMVRYPGSSASAS